MSFVINKVEIFPQEIVGAYNTPIHKFRIRINEKDYFGKLRFFVDEKHYKEIESDIPRFYDHYDFDYDTIYHGLVYNKSDLDKDISKLDGMLKIILKLSSRPIILKAVREALCAYDKAKKATSEL